MDVLGDLHLERLDGLLIAGERTAPPVQEIRRAPQARCSHIAPSGGLGEEIPPETDEHRNEPMAAWGNTLLVMEKVGLGSYFCEFFADNATEYSLSIDNLYRV
ncbi:hypothetical protein AB0392_37790 [Nonomuraea angiospora]|uniref:hypothetical protein n=1 Tax=Nonomuraea angiospora TaxID=46172 RepID=UPI00344E2E4A